MNSHYNDFPENWREIDSSEFAYKLVTFSANKQEFRQLINPDRPMDISLNAMLFHFHDNTGLAISYETIFDKKTYKANHIARFYAFGCKHEFVHLPWDHQKLGPQMPNQRAWKCSKCDYIEVIDSSD